MIRAHCGNPDCTIDGLENGPIRMTATSTLAEKQRSKGQITRRSLSYVRHDSSIYPGNPLKHATGCLGTVITARDGERILRGTKTGIFVLVDNKASIRCGNE